MDVYLQTLNLIVTLCAIHGPQSYGGIQRHQAECHRRYVMCLLDKKYLVHPNERALMACIMQEGERK